MGIAHFGITEPEADLRWEAQLAEVGVWEAAVAKAAAQSERELAIQERDESRARMAQHRYSWPQAEIQRLNRRSSSREIFNSAKKIMIQSFAYHGVDKHAVVKAKKVEFTRNF